MTEFCSGVPKFGLDKVQAAARGDLDADPRGEADQEGGPPRPPPRGQHHLPTETGTGQGEEIIG